MGISLTLTFMVMDNGPMMVLVLVRWKNFALDFDSLFPTIL
jgi:hypothetical protein